MAVHYIKGDRQWCFITLISAEEISPIENGMNHMHLFRISYSKCKTTNHRYKVYKLKWNESNAKNTLYQNKNIHIHRIQMIYISLISIPKYHLFCLILCFRPLFVSFVILVFYLFAVHQFNILHQRTVHLPDNYDDGTLYASRCWLFIVQTPPKFRCYLKRCEMR